MCQFDTRVKTVRLTSIHNQTIAASNRGRAANRETAANDDARTDQTTSSSRALIPLSPVQPTSPARSLARQPANFLAHLIATQQALPQTRERRRIEPGVATAIYATASAHASASAGLALTA